LKNLKTKTFCLKNLGFCADLVSCQCHLIFARSEDIITTRTRW